MTEIDAALLSKLACVRCTGALGDDGASLACLGCGATYPVADGVPVVLPGETIRVFVLKEGKEAGQGVAYLDDGTMIVVDNARRCIGRNVDVVVTSVLQTTAGRMIFTRLKEDAEREELQVARG